MSSKYSEDKDPVEDCMDLRMRGLQTNDIVRLGRAITASRTVWSRADVCCLRFVCCSFNLSRILLRLVTLNWSEKLFEF